MKKCKHKLVNMEDGTLDQFCVRCRKFQMRAIMNPLGAELSRALRLPLTASVMRETIEVGSEHKRVTVCKDDLMRGN